MKLKFKFIVTVLLLTGLTFILVGCESDSNNTIDEGGIYTLTVETNGNGTVDITPEKDKYKQNEVVLLEANPKTDYDFAYWEGTYDFSKPNFNLIMVENTHLKAHFGLSYIFEQFDNNDNWSTFSDELVTLEITDNNKYAMTIKEEGLLMGISPGVDFSNDFFGEVEFEFDSSEFYQTAGFILNNCEEDRYYFQLNNEGIYIINKSTETEFETLAEESTGYLKVDGVNKISCRKKGNSYTFYLNGQYMYSIEVETSYPNLGIAASCGENTPITIYFDNYKILALDSEETISGTAALTTNDSIITKEKINQK